MSKEKISKSDATEQVVSMCRRLAQLYISFAKTLVEQLGQQRGRELILQAISRYGQGIGQMIRQKVEAQGLPLTIENYRKFSDLPSLGFTSKSFIAGGERRTRIDECILASVWKELGEEELGRLYCFVDQAKIEAYNPGFQYIHLKNSLDSDIAYCETTIIKKRRKR
jgi:hypothetical protein